MAITNGVSAVAGAKLTPPAQADGKASAHEGDFLQTLHGALMGVSADQAAAVKAENAVATGAPGASMATALVLSDKAETAWNAVVAVRNEVVAAYQTLTNMQI